MLTPHQKVI